MHHLNESNNVIDISQWSVENIKMWLVVKFVIFTDEKVDRELFVFDTSFKNGEDFLSTALHTLD